MSRFLFAVFPVSGHVNPGLPIAAELVSRGHDVRWYSTPRFRRTIENIGARWVPLRQAIPIDEEHFDMWPGRPAKSMIQRAWQAINCGGPNPSWTGPSTPSRL